MYYQKEETLIRSFSKHSAPYYGAPLHISSHNHILHFTGLAFGPLGSMPQGS